MEKIIPVHITPKAIEEIKNTIDRKNIPDEYGLRIGVRGGLACGGGGFSFVLGFDKPREGDDHFRMDDIDIFIQKKDTFHLVGQTIDFYEGADARGFSFGAKNN
jgi:iron-sulfur cluster assembly protein